jgi:ribonuclease Z
MPTQGRSSSSMAVRRKGEIILFDCGEGAQRQMVAARIGFRRPMRIFISHLHGDHVLGLPGLIQTMTLLQRERPLHIYGPGGLASFIRAFSLVLGDPGFTIKIFEILGGGVVFEGQEYNVTAVEADHDGPSWSFVVDERPRPGRFHPERAVELGVPEGPLWKRLQQGEDVVMGDRTLVRSEEVVEPPMRGLKIAYSGDTRPTGNLVNAARGADILIHEATFDNSLEDKATENGHSTAAQAAEVAKAAGVGMLILTHISSRYPNEGILLEQAREIFPNTRVAEDLMEVEASSS